MTVSVGQVLYSIMMELFTSLSHLLYFNIVFMKRNYRILLDFMIFNEGEYEIDRFRQ